MNGPHDRSMQPWMHDVPRAIVESKRALRRQMPDLRERFECVDRPLRDEVAAVLAEQAAGNALPQIAYADIAAGRVTEAQRAQVRRRGCVIVRQVFVRERAEAWNEQLDRYVAESGYRDRPAERVTNDRHFTASPPARRAQILPLYWSPPQVQARASQELARTRAFLNRLWRYENDGVRHFDPDREATYADRLRRREPGDRTLGLMPHADGGSVERWCDPSFHAVYREVFHGDPLRYDPFDAQGRVATREIPSPNVCSAFRSFQGWTALTAQGPGDGTLQVVPIANAMAWMLLRALQDDVPDDDLCGAEPGRSLRAVERWHGTLLAALVSIPRVEPGDTVWWHSDVIHAVENRHQGRGYSNVLYIPAAPWCDKNEAYLGRQRPCFLSGRSAPDFPVEDYEQGCAGRGAEADLSPLGHMQMGLIPWA